MSDNNDQGNNNDQGEDRNKTSAQSAESIFAVIPIGAYVKADD